MLSDAERRCLDEIEQQLRVEEPDLARALAQGHARRDWVYYAVMVVFGALGLLLVAMGSLGVAMVCLFVGGVTALMHRYHAWII